MIYLYWCKNKDLLFFDVDENQGIERISFADFLSDNSLREKIENERITKVGWNVELLFHELKKNNIHSSLKSWEDIQAKKNLLGFKDDNLTRLSDFLNAEIIDQEGINQETIIFWNQIAVDQRLEDINEILNIQNAEEHAIWRMHVNMNETGIPINSELMKNLDDYIDYRKKTILEKYPQCKSNEMFKQWINEHTELSLEKVNKDSLEKVLLENKNLPSETKENIQTFLEINTLRKRYQTILPKIENEKLPFQFNYAASVTNRWSANPHSWKNGTLGKNVISEARKYILNQNYQEFEKLANVYNITPSELASQMQRSVIEAPKDKTILHYDYSGFEARLNAWLTGEQWVIDIFNDGKDFYKETIAKVLDVPVDSITPEQRKLSKIYNLAMQYGGSGKSIERGDVTHILEDGNYDQLAEAGKTSRPKLIEFYNGLSKSAITPIKDVINNSKNKSVYQYKNLQFECNKMPNDTLALTITLPDHKKLVYQNVVVTKQPEKIIQLGNSKLPLTATQPDYKTTIQYLKDHHGQPFELSSNILMNNITQGLARNIFAHNELLISSEIMKRIPEESENAFPSFIVHDETNRAVNPEYLDEYEKIIKEIIHRKPDWMPKEGSIKLDYELEELGDFYCKNINEQPYRELYAHNDNIKIIAEDPMDEFGKPAILLYQDDKEIKRFDNFRNLTVDTYFYLKENDLLDKLTIDSPDFQELINNEKENDLILSSGNLDGNTKLPTTGRELPSKSKSFSHKPKM